MNNYSIDLTEAKFSDQDWSPTIIQWSIDRLTYDYLQVAQFLQIEWNKR